MNYIETKHKNSGGEPNINNWFWVKLSLIVFILTIVLLWN